MNALARPGPFNKDLFGGFTCCTGLWCMCFLTRLVKRNKSSRGPLLIGVGVCIPLTKVIALKIGYEKQTTEV